MKQASRRLFAVLCAFCMLFVSMPVSAYTDLTPATPTDLAPVEEPMEQEIPETAEPEETQESREPEEAAEDPEPATETPAEEPADPTDEAEPEETDEPEIIKPEADREVTGSDDITVSGSLEGNPPADYLVRYTPEKNQTLCLILTTNGDLKASVTDENTGAAKQFIFDHTDEDGQNVLTLPYYKVNQDSTYLIRLSGNKPAEFAIRMVKMSILKAEEETAEAQEEEPADTPGDSTPETPAETTEETPAEAVTEAPEGTPEDTPAETAEDIPAESVTEMPEETPAETVAEPAPETPAEEPTETTVEAPAEIRIDTINAGTEASVTFLSNAGIPEDAELRVRELTPEEQAPYQARTVRALECGDESYLYYTKYLEISLLHHGEPVELTTPVNLSVVLPDVSEGAGALQAVRFDTRTAKLMDSEWDGQAISFRTDAFAVFGIGNAFTPLDTQETELASVEVLGFSADAEVALKEAEAPEVEEGLEVIGTFTVEDQTKAVEDEDTDGLWIKAELNGDANLTPMESVSLYRVEDGQAEMLVEDLSQNSDITELDAQQVAVIRDTGYRHLTLTVSPEDGNESQTVTLDGMMPKDAEAAIIDVTEQYADYTYSEEAPQAEQAGEQAEETETGDTRTTLAAYDISISHPDGEYQPDEDKPISVEILDERITAEGNIELWHFRDDGTREQVTDFTIEEGRIAFEATGFSVYIIIDHEGDEDITPTVVTPRVEFHFVADNPTPVKTNEEDEYPAYYIGQQYSFRNKNSETQHSQILKNGESLELIADPGNKTEKYFYGWYVVDPKTIDGTSNNYGYNSTDRTLYYTWPTAPVSVTFESPITIPESEVAIGAVVNWSIGDVSGSGTVDSDGSVHVLLAPVFENYNFINFMLFPRETSGQAKKTLMTRKMIALGSSPQVEVKISDIQSASEDPVHLIFTGWEYNAGTEEAQDWRQYQTIDYTGAEMKDPGKDGVYLGVNLDDTVSLDLYPMFVQARWVDFVSGVTGSGATYVASMFRESWGFDPANPPQGMAEHISGENNVFESLPVPTRLGYKFDGWYAFAVTDSQTGEITNLTTPEDVKATYLDSNYQPQTYTETMTAVRITDGNGAIAYTGDYTAGGYHLFSRDGNNLKLFDGLDRLTLYANWVPQDADITIIYWTENALLKGDTQSEYTASATRTISTADLTGVLPGTYASGSVITLDDLIAYDNAIESDHPELDDYFVNPLILDDVGAVAKKTDPNELEPREELFYNRDDDLTRANNIYYTLDDENNKIPHEGKVVDGRSTTVFNVYYSRKEFMLVFHIGRDNYLKNAGKQTASCDNWLEYMYNDPIAKSETLLGHTYKGKASPSYPGLAEMKDAQGNVICDSSYPTSSANIKVKYVPDASLHPEDANLYIITAKYGAYIGDRWPSPVNNAFRFDEVLVNGVRKALYIWTAAYNSLYHARALKREAPGNPNGNNPDINGVYEYMSAELCADRTGNGLINENRVHHLVAYFGEGNNQNRFKKYHFLYEKVNGVIPPTESVPHDGDEYLSFAPTTWSGANTNGEGVGVILDKSFYEVTGESPVPVISNLAPWFQLGTEIDGYQMIYSCYDETMYSDNGNPPKDESHVYFFYTPKKYKITYIFETGEEEEEFYYKQSLATAYKEVPEKTGYYFDGWYTNDSGQGEPFDFSNTTMPCEPLVLYPVYRVLQYTVKIDPNGGVIDHINYDVADDYGRKANDFEVTGSGYNRSQATYFTADYGTTIGEYTIKREYIKLTEKEMTPGTTVYYDPTEPDQDWYYYVNTQFFGRYDGDWGLPPNLRNAVYMTEEQLRNYHRFYVRVATDNLEYYTGVTVLSSFDDFAAAYTSYPSQPYRKLKAAESYTFMGWYQVTNGSIASMPFNFNEPVYNDMELRALWRLDGGYYIAYNPDFIGKDEQGDLVSVTGNLTQWTDPKEPSRQLYADQAPTHILQAPDRVKEGWVFRGWRVVKKVDTVTNTVDGQLKTYDVWEPIQLDEKGDTIYYQPGDHFTIDSNLISDKSTYGSIIHMQAFYELDKDSVRRPEIANLILDAYDEDAFITDADGTEPLAANKALPDLGDIGDVYLDADEDQIVFGNIQSSIAVHLNQYAVPPNNYFRHQGAYFLLGFDGEDDPHNDYIAHYPADSVIAVQRTDHLKLDAVWERMVYVTFVNTTDKDITIDLVGTGESTISIVNIASGKYDRKRTDSRITIPAKKDGNNGMVKIVLPGAIPGTDKFTATAVNDHIRRKMSVDGDFPALAPAETAYHTISSDPCSEVKYGGTVTYQQVLDTDRTGVGIVVTYTEEPVDEVIYNVNKGTWKQPLYPESGYEYRMNDDYALPGDVIEADPTHHYKPVNPTRDGMIFVGWTDNPDIAGQTNFSSETEVKWGNTTIRPDAGSNVLQKVKDEYLWNFETQDPPYNKTLYAVWSETATLTFDVVSAGNNTNHTWKGPTTQTTREYRKFVRESNNSRYITYTVMKGEKVEKPSNPTNGSWYFMEWVTAPNFSGSASTRAAIENFLFDFDKYLDNDQHIYTSWKAKTNYQVYNFTVHNDVVDPIDPNDEFTYTISMEDMEKYTGSAYVQPTFGSVTTQLKNDEEYNIRITIVREPSTSNTSHNYDGYDVYAEITDRAGNPVPGGSGHLLSYNGDDEARTHYKYTIRVAQTPKTGYSTYVSTDATGVTILTLLHNQFTFFSSNGNHYNLNVNPFSEKNDRNKNTTVIFTNRRKVDLTVTKHVEYDLGDRDSNFTFTLDSVEGDTAETAEYKYSKTRNNISTGEDWLRIGDTFTLKHGESITIEVPRNKAVAISEDNTNYTTTWTKDDTGTLELSTDDSNDAAATFTLAGDAAATVTNIREAKQITVKKEVDQITTDETFHFTATLLNDTTPIANYTIYTDPTDSNNRITTNARGEAFFTLKQDATQVLNIPQGAKLVVEEAFMLNYGPGAEMVDNNDTAVPDGDTKPASFTVSSITEEGTITFTNTPRAIPGVTFDVNGGEWAGPSDVFTPVEGETGRYTIDATGIAANNNEYEPNKPTKEGKVFIGWTTDPNIADETNFGRTGTVELGAGENKTIITTDAGCNLLEMLRNTENPYLWNFDDDPPYDQTLYAVWSDTVTVTFNLLYKDAKLHTWNQEQTATTGEEGFHVFYRSSDTDQNVTYTLAKGEKVPKPGDPAVYAENNTRGWHFMQWLRDETTVSSYKYTATDTKDVNLTNYSFDFTQPVTDDITLITSWVKSEIQTFSFKVENQVVNGNENDEFEYEIKVSDVWCYGKMVMTDTSLHYGEPNKTWDSASTTLKNGEQYNIKITVRNNNNTGNKAEYSVWIEVTDNAGNLVKEGFLLECLRQQNHYQVSDYKYTLTITQREKTGYTPGISVTDVKPTEDSISYGTDPSKPSYSFTVVENTRDSHFTDNDNAFVSGETNSLTVIFTNTAEQEEEKPAAPTGFTSRHIPFFLMLAAGLILMILLGGMRICRRRAKEPDGEETLSVNTIIPDTGPPGGGTSRAAPDRTGKRSNTDCEKDPMKGDLNR